MRKTVFGARKRVNRLREGNSGCCGVHWPVAADGRKKDAGRKDQSSETRLRFAMLRLFGAGNQTRSTPLWEMLEVSRCKLPDLGRAVTEKRSSYSWDARPNIIHAD